jgi:hypothetical protein
MDGKPPEIELPLHVIVRPFGIVASFMTCVSPCRCKSLVYLSLEIILNASYKTASSRHQEATIAFVR